MIKQMKRLFTILLSVTLLCSMPGTNIEAFATEADTEISGEIEVIFNRSEESMKEYIEAFERKYPKVDVKYTTYSDFETNIKKRMEEGDYGDVLYVPDFVSQNDLLLYFESLGNLTNLSSKYNYVDYGRYLNQSVYGIPSSAYLVGMIYNKEVFDKAGITELPTTIDEFLYAMYLINEHTEAIPFYSGYSDSWILQYWENFQFIEMTGNPSYRYGQFIVEKEPFREGTVHYKALRLLYDLVKNGYTEIGRTSVNWDKSLKMLNNGELGCVAMGTWALTNYKNAGENGDNIGFMPFPNSVDGQQYATLNVDYSYGVAKNSDNKDAAKAFVFFMLDESGYAFDNDTISLLKSDPYPECYDGMTQTSMRNSVAASIAYYNQFLKLSTDLDLSDKSEYIRIIDAAAGKTAETFDEIMNDWNTRWESMRDDSMVTEVKTASQSTQQDILNIDNINIELSDNELQYIAENPTLRVGYHENMSPLSFEVNGEFSGAAFDVCEMIAQNTGIIIEYYGYESTEALVAALHAGEIDMIAGIEKSDSNANVRYSKEYLNYMDVIVRHNTVDAVSQKSAAITVGENNPSQGVAQTLVSCTTIGDCVQKVQNMDVDYTITNYYSANYYVRERNCADVTILPYTADKTYHLGFSEETNPTLIAICNKCIYSIQDGEMLISLMDYMDSVVNSVTLKTFISANPMLALGIVIGVFVIVFGAMLFIFWEKDKANRKQVLAAQKHEMLAALADEYIFEYECEKELLTFDVKFREAFDLEAVVNKAQVKSDDVFLAQFLKEIEKSLEQKQNVQFTITVDKDGTKQWYRAVTSIIYDKKGQPVHLIGKLVSIQKEMEEVATYQNKAHRDALTKIYNREGFKISIPQEADNVTFAVMDMDNFKMVNDTLGHEGGDYALTYFARTLESVLGKEGIVGRYGGDEFVAMLVNVPMEEAKNRLDKLVKNMNVELEFGGNTRVISISVGAVFTSQMKSFEDMFRQADEVLYETKEAGKNSYRMKSI